MANFKKFHPLLLILLGASLLLQAEARAAAAASPDDWDDDWDDSEEKSEEAAVVAKAPESPVEQRSLGSSSDSHDDHHAQMQNADSDAPRSGFSGGSVSNYNESCDNKNCNPDRNLRCDPLSRKCICAEAHVYIRGQEKCYPFWKQEGKHSCEFHEQCEDGPTGKLSRCNRVKGSCECYDTVTGGKRDIAMFHGVCFVKRNINENCELDAECQTSMKVNSFCTADFNRVCACQKGYVWEPLLEECLKIADKGLTSDCKSSFQCTASAMGEISRCNPATKKCECHDGKNPGQDNIAYYERTGACFERKFWNSTCTVHEECKASVSSDAECLPQKDVDFGGTMLLICQCPEGKKCAPLGDGGGAEAVKGFNAVIILGIVMVFRGFRA